MRSGVRITGACSINRETRLDKPYCKAVKPHQEKKVFLPGLIALALAIGGCATVHSPHRQHLGSENAEVRNCAELFRELDTAVARNRVGEASPTQVAGFPYLRADRFTASLSDRAQQNDAAFEAWLSRLAALDREAREFEIGNLPAAAVAGLGHAGARAEPACTRLSRPAA